MNEEVRVRLAGPQDEDAIVALWHEHMLWHQQCDPRLALAPDAPAHWRETLRLWLENRDMRVLVAEGPAGQIVGFAIGMVRDNASVMRPARFGYINELAVTEAWRRRGIGRRLVQALFDWFTQQGINTYRLTAAHRNPVAQAFWRSLGADDLLDVLWGEIPLPGSLPNQ